MVGRVGLIPKVGLVGVLAVALTLPVLMDSPASVLTSIGSEAGTTDGSSAPDRAGGSGLTAMPADGSSAASSHVPVLATFGSHQYWIAKLVNVLPETDLASGPDGKVWLLDSRRPLVSTNGGQTWTPKTLTPANSNLFVIAEGDIAVAPNGDVLTNWLCECHPHNTAMYRSVDNGGSFSYTPLVGPQGFPDRPWVGAGAAIGSDPNHYLAITQAGTGLKTVWASNDRGLTWFLPTNKQIVFSLIEERPFPALPDNPFMDYVKPFGQGFDTDLLALPGGQWFDINSKLWTEDFLTWYRFPNSGLFGSSFPYWDASSDGTIYITNFISNATGWFIRWKYYDGTWHNGAYDIPLSAEPKYATGLLTSGTTPLMGIRSHAGSLLGINTREGTQDVLIRIEGANTATPTYTKENIGVVDAS